MTLTNEECDQIIEVGGWGNLTEEGKELLLEAKVHKFFEETLKIYNEGLLIPHCETTFAKMWLGDTHILRGLMYVVANMHLSNPDEGLHLHIAGPTMSGKSDSVKTALKLFHPNDQLIRTFSPKWIFHAGDKIHENVVVFSDDTVLDPEIAALYRNMLTSWHEGVTRGTVINNKPVDLTIPRHVSLILTSLDGVVEETVDGQDESRFLTLEVRRTPEQEREIRLFVQEEKENVQIQIDQIQTIWKVMGMLPPRNISLHKKIEKEIPIREFKRYLTLIKCNAFLHDRFITNDEDIQMVDEFLSYSKPMVDSQTPAYSRKEAAIMSVLTNEWKTTDIIKDETGMSLANVYRALHGTKGTFSNPAGGLMAKEKRLKIHFNPDDRIYSFKL